MNLCLPEKIFDYARKLSVRTKHFSTLFFPPPFPICVAWKRR